LLVVVVMSVIGWLLYASIDPDEAAAAAAASEPVSQR
jgi:hypothetical protein